MADWDPSDWICDQAAADHTRRFEDDVTATGTEFYTASGKLDSSLYHENVVDEVDGNSKFTRLIRYVTRPGYVLVQTYVAYDEGPLEFSRDHAQDDYGFKS